MFEQIFFDKTPKFIYTIFMWKLSPFIKLAVSSCVLIVIYFNLPLSDVLAIFEHTDRNDIILATALVLLLEAVGAVRLWVLTDAQGFSVGSSKLFRINLAARFYMLFIPGGALASIATRVYKLQRLERRRVAALSSVLIDRVITTAGLCLVGGAAWIASHASEPNGLGYIALMGLVASVSLLSLLVHPKVGRLVSFISELTSVPLLRRIAERWLDTVSLFHQMSWRALAVLLLLATVPHFIGAYIFLLLGASFEISLDLLSWCWIRTAVILATMIPISLAGLGVREVSLLVLLSGYGFSSESIVALGATIFGVSVLAPALIGGMFEGYGVLRKMADQAALP